MKLKMIKYVGLFEDFVFEELTRKEMETLIHDKTKMSTAALTELPLDDLLDVYLDMKNDKLSVDKITALVNKYEPETTEPYKRPEYTDDDIKKRATERAQDYTKKYAEWEKEVKPRPAEEIEYAANDILKHLQDNLPEYFESGEVHGRNVVMYIPSHIKNPEVVRLVGTVGDMIRRSKFATDVRSVGNMGNKIVIEIQDKIYPDDAKFGF